MSMKNKGWTKADPKKPSLLMHFKFAQEIAPLQ